MKSRALLRLRKLASENLKARGLLKSDVLGVLLAIGLVYISCENSPIRPIEVRESSLSAHFTGAWQALSARAPLGSDRNRYFG